ncbi:hypothetical protein [Paractinoplanes maris]|uniref:hypothetical protein n=1 Tax=Paractinoplanes maris TaxID=1734446 RepID=UPI0020211E46|nr:hypothetical protein [Actinoplanes maris]
MTARQPAEQEPPKSETFAFLQWVLSTWPRSIRAILLISAPIVGVLIFVGIAVTVIFYLKVDPQRWAAALGLGVVTAGVAKAVVSVRAWVSRRQVSSSPESAPSGTEDITASEGDAGAAGERQGDDDLRQ